MKTLFTMIAVLALASGFAMAEEESIPVNMNVQAFVEIEVLDPDGVNYDIAGTADADTDMGFHSGQHAEFSVTANAAHTLTITSSNGTWQASELIDPPYDTYEQVKFLGSADTFIGGSLYLIDPASPGSSRYWHGDNGNIVESAIPAGVKVWGIAAAPKPQLVGDSSNLTGIAGAIAPPDVYNTDAVITASVD